MTQCKNVDDVVVVVVVVVVVAAVAAYLYRNRHLHRHLHYVLASMRPCVSEERTKAAMKGLNPDKQPRDRGLSTA